MATSTGTEGVGRGILETWHTGVGIGIAGVIPMIAFNVLVGGKDLFPQFGLIPFAVLWGLMYVALTRIGPVERLASKPTTGTLLGVAFGFVVWWGPQMGKPIGEFVSVNAAVQAAAFGAVVGLLYALSTAGSGRVEVAEPTS